MRHLHVKGEIEYDYQYDTLTYRSENREYAYSHEFSNIVADIDKEDFVTGVRIMDASKVLGLPKYALRSIKKAHFSAQKNKEHITIDIELHVNIRNKNVHAGFVPKEKSTQIVEQAPAFLRDGMVEATISC